VGNGEGRASVGRRRFAAGALLALCALAAGARPAAGADASRGGVYAASDGKGEIRLLWFPPPESWPAGWRVEDAASGVVIAERIVPGDAAAVATLGAEERTAIAEFGEYLADDAEGRRLGAFVYFVKASTSWDFARALGLGRAFAGVSAGPRSYRVVGLDRDGRPTGLAIVSAPVDDAAATPLPPPPVGLAATAVTEGVQLAWTPPDTKGRIPVVAYLVFRDGGRETNRLLTPQPLLAGPRADPAAPVFLDAAAPRGERLTYRVLGVDPFGRRGEAAQAGVLATVVLELAPPLLKAVADDDRAELSWDPGATSGRAGFIIERGLLQGGPFELLTDKMLKPDARGYRDAGLVAGTYYFYRIRAVGPDGDVGEPSPATRVRAGGGNLPKPEGLKAEAGRIGIRLTWDQPRERVEGFVVERWSKAAGGWARLTARSTPKNSYDDFFPPQSSGTFRYRVRAVGYDFREGEPGREVEATLPDTLGPRPPQITGFDGAGGRVALRFAPSPDPGDVERVYVVRSDEPDADGFVVGEPLSGKASTFTDAGVVAGRRYWYRLVAFDKSENRGDLSAPVSVLVAAPPVGTPKAPVLKLRTAPLLLVEIGFAAPPAGALVIVERRAGSGPWVTVAGPSPGPSPLIDAGPPPGAKLSYRLRLQAADGQPGAPSDAAETTTP
jgi:hypothetical protein